MVHLLAARPQYGKVMNATERTMKKRLETKQLARAKAQVMVLKWEGVTLQRGDPKVCEGGKGVYG